MAKKKDFDPDEAAEKLMRPVARIMAHRLKQILAFVVPEMVKQERALIIKELRDSGHHAAADFLEKQP